VNQEYVKESAVQPNSGLAGREECWTSPDAVGHILVSIEANEPSMGVEISSWEFDKVKLAFALFYYMMYK
jgi:hypothetical protein